MTFNILINEIDIESIKNIPYFQSSVYHDLNISATLEFFSKRYVAPINSFINITNSTVVDCGAGHGWFSIAYILAGGKCAVAVDVDEKRLDTAFKIAKILDIDDKIKFLVAPIHAIPLSRDYADFFVSIETLEHVGKDQIQGSLQRIKDIASQGVLITTPNKYFPVIAHDSQLPFAHWLPKDARTQYSKLFGREKNNENNDFLSPFDMNVLFDKFEPATSCLTFLNFSDFIHHYPFYLPYGANDNQRWKQKPSVFKSGYYRLVSTIFGKKSHWVMPNMAHIFIRRYDNAL